MAILLAGAASPSGTKAMETDAGLKPTRDIRERISRDLGNDPRRLVGYYMEYQHRFSGRLRPAPDGDEAAEHADATDRPPAGR